jgi:phosphonate transport system substrate-binding protein
MLKTILMSTVALVTLSAAAVPAVAQDIKEFRVGILGGENEADRLRNYQCLADHLKEIFGFEKVSLRRCR